MERNTWNIRVRSSGVDRRNLIENSNNKGKDSWGYSNHYHGDHDLVDGFSWPPRSYTCSFCKREFRSAQALGGHMNVHRRDRARLRTSPPWEGDQSSNHNNHNLNQSPNPNPNPNFSSCISPSIKVPPFTYKVPTLLKPSPSCLTSPPSSYSKETKIPNAAWNLLNPSSSKDKAKDFPNNMKALKRFPKEDESNILKKGEMVMLDLEIGLRSSNNNTNEDLDLELRLGYT